MILLVGLVVLVAAGGLAEDHYKYSSTSKIMRVGDLVNMTNMGFPQEAPSMLRQTWMVMTSQGAVINLNCTLRLPQKSPCGEDVLTLSDGIRTNSFCGHHQQLLWSTSEHVLFGVLKTGKEGGGFMECHLSSTALPVTTPAPASDEDPVETTTESKWAYLDVKSVEIDSSEHGGPQGPRKTTCPCGWANKDSKRVFGGRETGVSEFPWMAGVSHRSPVFIFCGATLVTPSHAITAAQCTAGKSRLALVLGEHDYKNRTENKNVQVINIRQVVEHEGFDRKKFHNDIAVLVLEKKVEFSKTLGPACLPHRPLNVERQYVKTMGWGKSWDRPYGSTMLMKVNLRVVAKSSCAALNPLTVPPGSKGHLCTWARKKSTCSYGDSGGPVVWLDPSTNRFVLVGVVSYGANDCGIGLPRVNTDVSAHLDWISKTIKDTDSSVQTCVKAK